MTDSPDAGAPRTALLIDDEAYFRRFVGEVLRKSIGVTVVEATNGVEGLQRYREHPPEFVLLDINMPHMGGLETLAALRRLSATVPIVMLTSVSEEKVVEECVGQGASFFIRKDVAAHELAAALRETLDELLDGKPPSA